MLGDLPRYARHVRGAPRKDIYIGAEKVDEHHFLFAIEGGTDLQRLVIGVRSCPRAARLGTFLIPLAGSKLPVCWCVESKASLAILSRVAARASSSA